MIFLHQNIVIFQFDDIFRHPDGPDDTAAAG
jgi:hypothetical protein